MKKCIYCGAELPDDAKACSNCGRPVPNGDTDGSESASGTADQQNSDSTSNNKEDHSGEGYWQFGVWHPVDDLNKQQSDNNAQQNNQDSWNNQNQQNGWNDQSQQNGWNSQNQQNGWNDQNQQNGWNNQNQQGGWNGQNGWNDQNNNGWSGQNGGWDNQNQWNNQNQQNGWYNQNNWNGQNWNSQSPYNNQTNTLATVGFVFGILALLFGEFFFIPCVVALVLGIAALVQIKKNKGMYNERSRVFAILAIVFGAISMAFWIYIYVQVYQMMSDPSFMLELEQYMEQGMNGTSSSASSLYR